MTINLIGSPCLTSAIVLLWSVISWVHVCSYVPGTMEVQDSPCVPWHRVYSLLITWTPRWRVDYAQLMTRYWNLTATQRPELAIDFILGVVHSIALDRDLRILCPFWIIAFHWPCQHFLSIYGFSPCSLISVDHRTDIFNFLELKFIHPSFFIYPAVFQKSPQTKTRGRSLSLPTKEAEIPSSRWIQGQSGAI